MRKKFFRLIIAVSVALVATFTSAFSSYAALPPIVSPNASEYIAMYSGSASSPSSGKIKMTASLRVVGVASQITAKIYKNGSFYKNIINSSDTGRVTISKTESVPSGSYYVLYKYQAVVDGVVVETRTIQTSTFTVS